MAAPGGKLDLVVTARNADERYRWVKILHVRVAPVSLLRSQFKELVKGSAMNDARSQVEDVLIGNSGSTSLPVNLTAIEYSAGPCSKPLPEKIEKFGWLANLNLDVPLVIGTIAAAVKMRMEDVSVNLDDLAVNAERVANVAKDEGDATGCVAALSFVFQLIALGSLLLRFVQECMRHVLRPFGLSIGVH